MPTYVALLRAVNVGGTGKLPMADLRKVLEGLGFKNVETYIQSGNVVFDAAGSAAKVRAAIAAGLEKLMGTPVEVMVRTHEDLSRIIAGNPFAAEAAADGARVHVGFLAGRPRRAHRARWRELSRNIRRGGIAFTWRGTWCICTFPMGLRKRSSAARRWTRRLVFRELGETGIRCSSCTRCRSVEDSLLAM